MKRKIKSYDPTAYTYGFNRGKKGESLPKEKGFNYLFSAIAPELLKGWKEGYDKYKRKHKLLKVI